MSAMFLTTRVRLGSERTGVWLTLRGTAGEGLDSTCNAMMQEG